MDSSASRVHFVTLGCPKNRVDSELMLGRLQEGGLSFCAEPEEADVLVVNTCGFINDAKEESIEVVVELARQRAAGRAQRLIVTGCLAQRYAQALYDEIPEIDVILGTEAYDQILKHATQPRTERIVDVERKGILHQATTPRVNSFMPHSAFVKISEGCNQACAFCVIPSLRGKQKSRPVEDIAAEVHGLVGRGIVEVNLIAQDLTNYGTDLGMKDGLAELLEALGPIPGLGWLRLHYAYPRRLSDRLLAAIREQEAVLPYIDIPLQHIADPVLKRMRRGHNRRFIEALLDRLREQLPGLTLRSSFIVGFPGETEADFQELCDFVAAQGFDRVGVFSYSHEEDTTAYDLTELVPAEVIAARHNALMTQQKEQSNLQLERLLGQRIEVLVDGPSEETELLLAARHAGQAPGVDGTIYINDGEARAGDRVEVEITETFDYDAVGHITRVLHPAPPRPEHPRLDAGYKPRASLPVIG